MPKRPMDQFNEALTQDKKKEIKVTFLRFSFEKIKKLASLIAGKLAGK